MVNIIMVSHNVPVTIIISRPWIRLLPNLTVPRPLHNNYILYNITVDSMVFVCINDTA